MIAHILKFSDAKNPMGVNPNGTMRHILFHEIWELEAFQTAKVTFKFIQEH